MKKFILPIKRALLIIIFIAVFSPYHIISTIGLTIFFLIVILEAILIEKKSIKDFNLDEKMSLFFFILHLNYLFIKFIL